MTYYEEKARSNYFRIKRPRSFEKAIARAVAADTDDRPVEIVKGSRRWGNAGKVALIAEDGWPFWSYDPDEPEERVIGD